MTSEQVSTIVIFRSYPSRFLRGNFRIIGILRGLCSLTSGLYLTFLQVSTSQLDSSVVEGASPDNALESSDDIPSLVDQQVTESIQRLLPQLFA